MNIEAAREVLEQWLMDIGIDIDSKESDELIRRIVAAATRPRPGHGYQMPQYPG